MQIVDGGDAPAGDQLNIRPGDDLTVEVAGGTLQHAILRDIGADHITDTLATIGDDEVDHILLRLLLPAVGGDHPVVTVRTEDDLVGAIICKPLLEECRLLLRDAAAGDLCCAIVEGDAHILIRLDATAEVDLQRGLRGYLLQHTVVDDMFRFCTIEIYQMQVRNAVLFELPRDLQRVVAIGLAGTVVAFRQAYALAVDDIYGGDDSHRN